MKTDLSLRMSNLIKQDINELDHKFGDGPFIHAAIKDLEQGKSSGIKSATLFKKLPLKGFWHAHYYTARFVPQNLINELKTEGGIGKHVTDTLGGAPRITPEMIDDLVWKRIVGAGVRRRDRNKLTGEWIVFLRHEDENYYLCCATHTLNSSEERSLYERIMDGGSHNFPGLLTEYRGR
jgi:hypothetical protein